MSEERDNPSKNFALTLYLKAFPKDSEDKPPVAELANVSNLTPHQVAAHLRTMKSVGLIELQARQFSKVENVPALYQLKR